MARVFISYLKENVELIEKLVEGLEIHGVDVWIDYKSLKPGVRWKDAIGKEIKTGDYFIACFSQEYHNKSKSYMNEELIIALEEIRLRKIDDVWFIPIRLDDSKIPDRVIGAGETLNSLQRIDLFKDWEKGINKILETINQKPLTSHDLLKLAIEYSQKVEYEKTKILCDQSIGLKPSVSAYQIKGLALRGLGFDNEAISCFDQILKSEPNNIAALEQKGASLITMSKHNEADKCFEQVLKTDPNNLSALRAKATILGGQRDYDAAIDMLKKILEIEPNDKFALYGLDQYGASNDKKASSSRMLVFSIIILVIGFTVYLLK